MQLSDYLTTNDLTDAAFGERIGVSGVSVHRYCAGERIPALDVMRRIIAETGGAVTANDFYGVAAE